MAQPFQLDRNRQVTVEDIIDCRRFVQTRDYNVLVDMLVRWIDPKPSRRALLVLTLPEMSLLQMAFGQVLAERVKTVDTQIAEFLRVIPPSLH